MKPKRLYPLATVLILLALTFSVWGSTPTQAAQDSFFPPASNVLAQFEFINNSLDSSGNNRHATLIGGATYTTTTCGTGLQLDTIGEGLDWSIYANLLVHPFTIEMILTPTQTTNYARLFNFDDNNDNGWYYATQGIQAYPNPVLGAGTVLPNQRHYIAFVSTSTTNMDVYFQGALLGNTGIVFSQPIPNAIFFKDNVAGNEQMLGVVDAMRISSVSRTPAEIAAVQLAVANCADTTAPTVTIVSVSPDPTNAGTTVTWNADENGTYSVRVGGTSCTDGATVASGSYATSPGNISSIIASGDLVEGLNTLRVCVTDVGNNTGSAASSVTKDTAAPTVTITSGPANPTNSTSASFVFSTAGSPVAIECELDGGGFVACDTATTQAYSGPLSAVSHTFTVRVTDAAGNYSTDTYTWAIDTTAPTVTITSGPANPTNSTFASFVFTTAGNPAAIECDLDGGGFIACDTATTHDYAGPLVTGSHTFTVRVTDTATNFSTDTYTWAIDTAALTVTVEQAATQSDPTNVGPILFTAVFNKPINPTTFDNTDVTLGGTASGTLIATIVETAPNDNTTFEISVSGMAGPGTVTASIGAARVQDPAGNNNSASTSADNTVIYDTVYPYVVATNLTTTYLGTGPSSFLVTFNKSVDDPAGNTGTDDVTNVGNYLLINKGINGSADTTSCAGGVVADDTQVTVTSVSYNSATFQATVTLTGPLPVGSYRLFICGTTSIVDLAGNPLNGGTDYTFDFVVQVAQQPAPQTATTSLPATGFPMDRVTPLPSQPAISAYASTDLWLEIPNLGIKMSIVGVPSTAQGWDVTWLDKNAGWLEGSAFPTWKGNSVITAHVWDALNRPGPFIGLKTLMYGDHIKIHAFGQVYIYEIRENTTISPINVSAMLKHEEKAWITLITCEDYKEKSQTYASRRMVRAVLVKVTEEK